MALRVIGFYKKGRSPFPTYLLDPTFYILVSKDNKVKEFTLKLSGRYYYVTPRDLKDFGAEGYKNYTIITNFLQGENRDRIRESWGLSEEEYNKLIFEMYEALVREHSLCGCLKRHWLEFTGFLKFKLGRLVG